MIVSAEAMCRRATSISARAVSGSGATSRTFFAARSFRTSASAIVRRDEPDQRLVLERTDEPGRVRLPVGGRKHGGVDLEAELLARLAAQAGELPSVGSSD